MKNDQRQWLYKKDEEARIFEEGEEITEGWYDSPDPNHAEPMWGDDEIDDTPDVPVDKIDLPVSDDAPETFDCMFCDKTYTEQRWYDAHMLNKHDISVE